MANQAALRIDLLYDPDCGSHEEALARLHAVLAEEGCQAEIVTTPVVTREQAQTLRFLGSPTIRVNGADIEAGSESRHDYVLSCRAYLRPDGRISGLPPVELIRAALRRAYGAVPNDYEHQLPQESVMAERPYTPADFNKGIMAVLSLGSAMPEFSLAEPATGGTVSPADLRPHGPVIVVFYGNQCPHSQAYDERLIQIARDYQDQAAMVLINPNDPEENPVNAPEAIAQRARERNYPFPYLFDEDQAVAPEFGAARTPEVFLFDQQRRLVFHGAVDDNSEDPDKVNVTYLRDAVDAVLAGKPVPVPTTPLGHTCGMKWREGRRPAYVAPVVPV